MFKYAARTELAPLLKALVHESAAPLRAVETTFATDSTGFATSSRGTGKSDAWRRLWLTFEARNDEFLVHHHQRSNVESTFSMIKRKFGSSVRAKTFPAQINEVLLKCLGHNLTVLVHAIHELGIEPSFWSRMEAA